MNQFLCPQCLAVEHPDKIERWDLMASMAFQSLDMKDEHPNYPIRTLAFYLQAAFERGKKSAEKSK